MKNLTDFKKVLNSCLVHKLEIKSKAINKNGEIVKENDFAPVGHIQSNSFAMMRNNVLSWCEYGKASQWKFEGKQATKTLLDGGRLVFEIKDADFFGL